MFPVMTRLSLALIMSIVLAACDPGVNEARQVPMVSTRASTTTTSAVAASNGVYASRYVGLRYTGAVKADAEFPPGVVHVGFGYIVYPKIDGRPDVGYLVAQTREGSHEMLWFVRGVGQEPGEVIDAVDVPTRAENEDLLLGSCSTARTKNNLTFEDNEIIALVRVLGAARDDLAVVEAWRFNRETEKIEPYSDPSMTCRHTRYVD